MLLSRRAGGSMRDSQSLLEQLLAVGGRRITVEDVNNLLGTASDERLSRLADTWWRAMPRRPLSISMPPRPAGVDTGQLLDQLLVYFRDLMVAAVGGSGDIAAAIRSRFAEAIGGRAGQQLGLQTVLAAMQVLDHTIARLRLARRGAFWRNRRRCVFANWPIWKNCRR